MELSVDHDKMVDEILANMEDLHNRFGVPELKPGEFTIIMYAEQFNLDRGSAKRELADAIAAGELIEVNEERRVDGKRVKHVYKKAVK